MPFQPLLLAVNPDGQIVLFADGDLAGVQNAPGAVVEAKQDVAVVVELPAFDENAQVRTDFLDFQPGDILGEVLGVRTVRRGGTTRYEVKVLLPGGRVRVVPIDAQSGRLLGR